MIRGLYENPTPHLYINSSPNGKLIQTYDYPGDRKRSIRMRCTDEKSTTDLKRYVIQYTPHNITYSTPVTKTLQIAKFDNDMLTIYQIDVTNDVLVPSSLSIKKNKQGDINCDGIFDIADVVLLQKPTITFKKGDASVKLSWTAVDGAEKYGVVGWINNRWQLIDQCEDTSYLLNNLKAGYNYKVAVVTMIGDKCNKDLSNAITVTPLTSAVSKYPNVTNIKYSDKYHQFKLEWNAVDGATQYGIAVKLAGKWKVWTYTDKTNFISPKLKAGSTAEMVICAKINGEWDTRKINCRSFVVTVK